MNSMREIFDFVGISGPNKYLISQGAYHAVTPDPNMNWVGTFVPQPTMRWVGRMIPVLSDSERTSMKAMIQGLQNLPPITLEADAKDTVDEIPFVPEIHVGASTGVIYETTLGYFRDGRELPTIAQNLGASEGTFNGSTFDDPGNSVIEVRRTGVASTGITTLRKSFDIIARAPPAPPTPPDPDPDPPFISVQSKGGGNFEITGKKFKPNWSVYILVGDEFLSPPIVFTVTSTPDGKFEGFPTGNICSGRLATRVFIANDGRLKPSDHSQLVSNTVKMSCPA